MTLTETQKMRNRWCARKNLARIKRKWQGQPCLYCGKPAQGMDHIVPLSRGGSNRVENLVPSCTPCNASKADRLLEHLDKQ